MNRLLFPQEVYTGPDALANVFNRDYGSILLLADMATPHTAHAARELLHTFSSMLTETTLITAPDAPRLFGQAYAFANVEMPECLLAIGSGFVQDCAAAVAHAVPLPYVAVPTAAPTQLTECDTLDPFLYRTMPAVCILDPVFITAQDSQQLAYEALGMLTLALDAVMQADDSFVAAAAQHAFRELFCTILPAYRGEIAARRRLCSAMYGAMTAYLNSFPSAWQSPAYRIASFFSGWNDARLTTLAVCLPHLTQKYAQTEPQKFAALAEQLSLTAQPSLAADALVRQIRRMQATLAFPAGMKTIVTEERAFLGSSDTLPPTDRDFYFQCYYGTVNFVKKESKTAFA